MGSPIIFSGNDAKTLKPSIDLFGTAKLIGGNLNPTVTAVDAPKGSQYLSTSQGLTYVKQDAGSTTNWIAQSGSKNYIAYSNGNSIGDWVTFINSGGGNLPTTGVGLPAVDFTLTTTTSSPLSGSSSFLLTAVAANQSSQGVSVPFTIDREDQSNLLNVSFAYNASSGFVAGDGTPPLMDGGVPTNSGNSGLQVFIRDEDNGILVPVNSAVLTAKGDSNFKYSGTFQTSSNALNYRLILYCPRSVGAPAYTFKFDSVSVAPTQAVVASQIITARAVASFAQPTDPTQSINFDVVQFDTNAAITVGSAWKFIAPVSGLYDVEVAVQLGAVDSLYLYKNGAISNFITYTSSNLGQGSTKIQLVAGDYIDVRSGSAQTTSNSDTTAISISCAVPVSIAAAGVVAASMYTASSGVSVSANTPLVLPLTVYDTNAGYASNQYTIPVSGFYEVSAYAAFSTGTNVGLVAYKNGTALKYVGFGASIAAFGSTSFQALAGDIIDVRPDQSITQEVDTHWEIIQIPSMSVTSAPESVTCVYGLTSAVAVTAGNTLIFDTKIIDSHSAYAAGEFTAPISGSYQLSVINETTAGAARTYAVKGATALSYLAYCGASITGSGSIIVPMVAGDTLKVVSNDSVTYAGGSAPFTNYLSIQKVG